MQLEASYQTNEEQLNVNEKQAELIIQQADQIALLNEEKKLLTEQLAELEELRVKHLENMTEAANYQEVLENRVYDTNKRSLELLTQIRDM